MGLSLKPNQKFNESTTYMIYDMATTQTKDNASAPTLLSPDKVDSQTSSTTSLITVNKQLTQVPNFGKVNQENRTAAKTVSFPSVDVGTIESKRIHLGTFAWAGTDLPKSRIATFTSSQMRAASETNWKVFGTRKYIRVYPEITISFTTPPQFTGALMVYYTPAAYAGVVHEKWDFETLRHFPFAIIRAGSAATVTLRGAFIDVYRFTHTDSSFEVGDFRVAVYNSLRVPTGAKAQVQGTVSLIWKDPYYIFPILPAPTPTETALEEEVKNLKIQISQLQNPVRMPATGVIEDIMEVAAPIASLLSVFDKPDRPTGMSTCQDTPILTTPMFVSKKDYADVDLSLTGMTTSDNILDIVKYASYFTRIDTLLWEDSAPSKTRLAFYPLEPFMPTALKDMETLFKLHRGGFKFRLEVIKSTFHQGSLIIVFTDKSAVPTTAEINASSTITWDIATQPSLAITVPHVSNVDWTPLGNVSVVFMHVMIMTPLEAGSSTSDIDINVEVCPLEDVKFAVPSAIKVFTKTNAIVQHAIRMPATSDTEPKAWSDIVDEEEKTVDIKEDLTPVELPKLPPMEGQESAPKSYKSVFNVKDPLTEPYHKYNHQDIVQLYKRPMYVDTVEFPASFFDFKAWKDVTTMNPENLVNAFDFVSRRFLMWSGSVRVTFHFNTSSTDRILARVVRGLGDTDVDLFGGYTEFNLAKTPRFTVTLPYYYPEPALFFDFPSIQPVEWVLQIRGNQPTDQLIYTTCVSLGDDFVPTGRKPMLLPDPPPAPIRMPATGRTEKKARRAEKTRFPCRVFVKSCPEGEMAITHSKFSQPDFSEIASCRVSKYSYLGQKGKISVPNKLNRNVPQGCSTRYQIEGLQQHLSQFLDRGKEAAKFMQSEIVYTKEKVHYHIHSTFVCMKGSFTRTDPESFAKEDFETIYNLFGCVISTYAVHVKVPYAVTAEKQITIPIRHATVKGVSYGFAEHDKKIYICKGTFSSCVDACLDSYIKREQTKHLARPIAMPATSDNDPDLKPPSLFQKQSSSVDTDTRPKTSLFNVQLEEESDDSEEDEEAEYRRKYFYANTVIDSSCAEEEKQLDIVILCNHRVHDFCTFCRLTDKYVYKDHKLIMNQNFLHRFSKDQIEKLWPYRGQELQIATVENILNFDKSKLKKLERLEPALLTGMFYNECNPFSQFRSKMKQKSISEYYYKRYCLLKQSDWQDKEIEEAHELAARQQEREEVFSDLISEKPRINVGDKEVKKKDDKEEEKPGFVKRWVSQPLTNFLSGVIDNTRLSESFSNTTGKLDDFVTKISETIGVDGSSDEKSTWEKLKPMLVVCIPLFVSKISAYVYDFVHVESTSQVISMVLHAISDVVAFLTLAKVTTKIVTALGSVVSSIVNFLIGIGPTGATEEEEVQEKGILSRIYEFLTPVIDLFGNWKAWMSLASFMTFCKTAGLVGGAVRGIKAVFDFFLGILKWFGFALSASEKDIKTAAEWLKDNEKKAKDFASYTNGVTSTGDSSMLLYSTEACERFGEWWKYAFELEEAIMPLVWAKEHFAKLLLEKVKAFKEFGKKLDGKTFKVQMQCEPVVIYLYSSDGGTGKTLAAASLARYFAELLSDDPTDVYNLTSGQKHWTGYAQQSVVLFDDFACSKESDDYDNFNQIISSTTVFVPQAALEEKFCVFNTPLVIISSNRLNPDPVKVTKSTAVIRRYKELTYQFNKVEVNDRNVQWVIRQKKHTANDSWTDVGHEMTDLKGIVADATAVLITKMKTYREVVVTTKADDQPTRIDPELLEYRTERQKRKGKYINLPRAEVNPAHGCACIGPCMCKDERVIQERIADFMYRKESFLAILKDEKHESRQNIFILLRLKRKEIADFARKVCWDPGEGGKIMERMDPRYPLWYHLDLYVSLGIREKEGKWYTKLSQRPSRKAMKILAKMTPATIFNSVDEALRLKLGFF